MVTLDPRFFYPHWFPPAFPWIAEILGDERLWLRPEFPDATPPDPYGARLK
jgi:hypothetical protein